MTDTSKTVSELPTAANVASTDRIVVLRNPANSPSVRTVAVNNFVANSTTYGVVKVGSDLSINATGHLLANYTNVNSNIIPSNTHNLGSSNNPWDTLYVSKVINSDNVSVISTAPNIIISGTFTHDNVYNFTYSNSFLHMPSNTYISSGAYPRLITNLFYDYGYDYSGVTSIVAENIGAVNGGIQLSHKNEPYLTSISFPQLIYSNDIVIIAIPALTSMDLSNLKYINSDCVFYDMPLITSIDLPKLEVIMSEFYVGSSMSSLATINLPKLKYVQSAFEINIGNPYINGVSISANSLTHIGGGLHFYNSNVSSLSIPSIKHIGGDTYFSNLNNADMVDNIFNILASLDGSNNTTTYAEQSIQIYGATPTSNSANAISILTDRACSITHS